MTLIPARPWTASKPPRRILAIRLQAMGDVVISLPYLQRLRELLPADTRIDFLVLRESSPLPLNLELFDKIFIIDGGRRFKLQLLYTMPILVRLFFRRYDVVLDVQNSPISRLVRRVLRPRAWCEFDKVSTLPAGERTRRTIEAAGFSLSGDPARGEPPWVPARGEPPWVPARGAFRLRSDLGVDALLRSAGWDGVSPLVILNPAGAFPTRHWPEVSYEKFAKLWREKFPDTQFLFLGIPRMRDMAARLCAAIGPRCINLVEQTTPAQAFAIIQKIKFILSEDGGLMHMAWVSGIPTLALFGSSRSDWARPLGARAAFLDAEVLECAPCMLETCRLGDTRCMSLHTPEKVIATALRLLE